MELLVETGAVATEALQPLTCEGNEILAIVVASLKTKKANEQALQRTSPIRHS
jgi:hypothetical protein